MEEVKSTQNPPPTQDPNPPQQEAPQPPAPPQQEAPQPPAPPQQPPSKKRSLENDQSQNSNYFKMRRLLKDLRPHFIEVLRTPDFRNCKASNDIKEKLKLLSDLYEQITTETVPLEKFTNAEASPPLPGESGMKQKLEEQPQVVKPAENKTYRSISVVDKQESENGQAPVSYTVGGSAFGWNFITFAGKEPVYYGLTKESFRSTHSLKQV